MLQVNEEVVHLFSINGKHNANYGNCAKHFENTTVDTQDWRLCKIQNIENNLKLLISMFVIKIIKEVN